MFDIALNFSIPYVYFLIAYLFVLGMVLFTASASLYHLVKYGFMSALGLFMTFLLIAGTLYILLLSYEAIVAIDWQQEITLGQSAASYDPY